MTTNLPAYLQNKPVTRRMAEAVVANIGIGQPPYVSIKGNRFTLVDSAGDSEPVQTAANGIPYLDCVIIDALERESKIYYAKPFDPSAQNYAPPDCWSDNGVAPSVHAGSPQARTCAPDPTGEHGGCKWAVWGSATSKVSGKGIPACSKNQKLALIIPGDDVVFLLRVPPNSLDNLRNYMRKFEGQAADVLDVLTRISFAADTLGTLTFQAVSYLEESVVEFRNKVLTAKATDALIGRNDVPRGAALPSPTPTPQIAAPSPPPGGSIAVAPAQTQTAPLAPAASPSEAPTGTRRGRRKASEMPQATNGGQLAAGGLGAPAPFTAAPAPADAAPGQNFGISSGVAPNPELSAALDSLFGPGK